MRSQRKKRIIIAILVFLILFSPIPAGVYDDGGTTDYFALTYRIVHWKRLQGNIDDKGISFYENTCVYVFPLNFLSIGTLWDIRH